MPDTSWDNGGAATRSPRRPWLKWALLGIGFVFVLPLLMTATFGGLALRHRAQLWPVVRTVHARLQSDQGAKDLFTKNPELANTYMNEQDFLDTVRAWRGKLGDLPSNEPAEGPTYSSDADPGGVSAAIQGTGGAWLRVEIRGGTLAGPIEGEGITRLFFGEDKKALRAARKNANALRTQREWEGFRKLMLDCGDDGKAADLYRREPGLHAHYPNERAFLESVQPLRPAIAKLPVTLREDGGEFAVRTYRTPFSHSRVASFLFADGRELRATWESGQLSKLELRQSNHRG